MNLTQPFKKMKAWQNKVRKKFVAHILWMLITALFSAFISQFQGTPMASATQGTQGLVFVPAPNPYRICDTRPGNLTQCANHTLSSGATINVQVANTLMPNGQIGVPQSAQAAVLNVTATNTTGAGYFSVYPEGTTLPSVSSLNWSSPNETRANLVQTPLLSGGVSAYLFGGQADLIIDVEGWYVPNGYQGASLYYPISPIRICDTRPGTSAPCSKSPLSAQNPLIVNLSSFVASGTSAVTVNVTVIGPTQSGYITLYPYGQTKPNSSNQNFAAGEIIPGRAIISVTQGITPALQIAISGGSANIAVDLNGYYEPQSQSASGSAFYATSPARIADTRCQFRMSQSACQSENIPSPNADISIFGVLKPTQEIEIGDIDNIGNNVSAIIINLTVSSLSNWGYLDAFPAGSPPTVSDLNWTFAGQTAANSSIVTLSSFNGYSGFDIYSYSQSQVIVDVTGYFAPLSQTASPLSITPGNLSPGVVNNPYVANIEAAGGIGAPYTWSSPSGLPGGLNLCQSTSDTCRITGILNAGSYSFSLRVSDLAGNSFTQNFTLTIGYPSFSSKLTDGNAAPLMDAISCATSSFCVATGTLVSVYSGSGFSTPSLVDPQAAISAISCPTTTFCLGVDTSGQALVYNGSSWSSPVTIDTNPGYYGLTAISCASATFCQIGDDNGQVIQYTNGFYSAPQMISPIGANSGAKIEAISCVSSIFCLAADASGNIFSFNGFNWSAPTYFDNQISALSCPMSGFCVLVDRLGNSFTYSNGVLSQKVAIDPGNILSSISCSSYNVCEAVDLSGNALTFNGSTWSSAFKIYSGSDGILSVSCAASNFCVAVSSAYEIFSGISWSNPKVFTGVAPAFVITSCPQVNFCLSATNLGQVILLNAQELESPIQLDSGVFGFLSISCPSISFCLIGDNGGRVFLFNGQSFTEFSVEQGVSISAISCPAINYCFLGDLNGNVILFQNSTYYFPTHVDVAGAQIASISCPSTNFCVAVDNKGYEITYINGQWGRPNLIDSNLGQDVLTSVSCSSTSFCLATDFEGQAIIYQNGNWLAPQLLSQIHAGFASVSCALVNFCLLTNWIGQLYFYNGNSFTSPTTIDPTNPGIIASSCPTPSYCVVSSDESGLYFTVEN